MSKKTAKIYHYLITLEGKNATPGGFPRIGTFSNKLEWSGTRLEAFRHVFDRAVSELGTSPEATYVKCWSFEPNDL